MSRRATALLEVCLMTLLAIFTAWLFEAFLKWFTFWGWFYKAFLVILALFAIVSPKRSFRAYGFLPRNPRFTLKWSTVTVAVFTLPTVASLAISAALGIAKPAKLSPLSIILNVVFFMVFVGLIEEAYFRGYVQSRLNEVFERRWRRLFFKAWKVNYGTALLLASTIFALVHLVNYWNPLIPRWEPVWWMPIHILGCFAFGCLAGVLREVSGDIYVPASLHGSVMTVYTFLSVYANELALNISLFISWFIFFYILTSLIREAGGLAMNTSAPHSLRRLLVVKFNRKNRNTDLKAPGSKRRMFLTDFIFLHLQCVY